jgi:hypothetical protein
MNSTFAQWTQTQHVWLSTHNSGSAFRGQEDAWNMCQTSPEGGEGDRSQGCADPRGRTLERRLNRLSVSARSHVRMKSP